MDRNISSSPGNLTRRPLFLRKRFPFFLLITILAGFTLAAQPSIVQSILGGEFDTKTQSRWLALRVFTALYALAFMGMLFIRAPSYLSVFALSSGFMLYGLWQMGYVYDQYNYTIYHSLIGRNRDPTFLANDWYTSVSENINGYYLFAKFFGSLPESWAPCVFFVFWLVGVVSLGWIFVLYGRRVFSSRADLLFCSIGAFLLSFLRTRGKQWGTFTLGDNDLLYPFLTPQTLGLIFGFLGLQALLRGGPYLAGALLGLAINCHINTGQHFLLLMTALAMASGRVTLRKYVFTACIALIVGSPHLIPMLNDQIRLGLHGGGESGFTYVMISAGFRHPHHLLPSTWPLIHYIEVLAFLAIAAVGYFLRGGRNAYDHAYGIIVAASLVLCSVGWFFVEVVPVDIVAKTQLFRLTIIIKMICLPYGLYAILWILKRCVRRVVPWNLSALIGGGRLPALAALTISFLIGIPLFFAQTELVARPGSPVEVWVKGNTPDDSLFILPVFPGELREFPVRTNRAIVVDWQRIPFQGSNYVQWYLRICRLAGQTPVADLKQIQAFRKTNINLRYHTLRVIELTELAQEYGATHVLRFVAYPLEGLRPIYQDGRYLIYSIEGIGNNIGPQEAAAKSGS